MKIYHVKTLRIIKDVLHLQNSKPFLAVSPDLLLGVSAGYCQKTLHDGSGIFVTQIGMQSRSQMVAVHGTLCVIPPRNISSNQSGNADIGRSRVAKPRSQCPLTLNCNQQHTQ
jgi:hypothetical protein